MLSWSAIRTKYLKSGSYELLAVAVIVLAVVLRIVLVALGWPQLDSDEGTIGIMGMHILYRGEHPIFFYAQGYMGAMEAYLAAIMFFLFGVSTFALRFGLILLFAVFLVGMYFLTSRLYTKKWAVITLCFLCLGSAPILTRELVAIGGYAETLVFGVLLLLLSLWLAFTAQPTFSPLRPWRRLLAYTLWGLIAGFAFYTDALIAPFIITGGLLILVFCWRDLLGLPTVLLLVGVLIGIYPMIIYNLNAPPDLSTWAYLRHIQLADGLPPQPFRVIFPRQLFGALFISMPGATGANPLCYSSVQMNPATDVHLLKLGSLHGIRCTLTHTGWAIGIVVLWLIAVLVTSAALWRLYRSSPHPWAPEAHRSVVRYAGRLALLLNGLIVFLLFLDSPAAAYFPVPDMRYLECLLVTTPALLWAMWDGLGLVKPLALRVVNMATAIKLARMSFTVRRGILLLLGLVFLIGTFSTFSGYPAAAPVQKRDDAFAVVGVYQYQGVPATQAFNNQETGLIRDLERIGATHIYSDYWTCDRLIFRSQEHIICTALNNGLNPGHNRYTPYCTQVTSDPHAAFVFRANTYQAKEVLKVKRHVAATHQPYEYYTFDGYIVYRGSVIRSVTRVSCDM